MTSYSSTSEILEVIQVLRPSFTTSNINAGLQGIATTTVDNELMIKGVTPSGLTDYKNLLKRAEICFYMDLAGMTRQIENSTSMVQEERYGKVTKRYTNTAPMFFFAQGGNDNFIELLQNETWRMKAYRYIRGYVKWFSRQHDTSDSEYICVGTDNYSRGHDWDELPEDVEGDYVENSY